MITDKNTTLRNLLLIFATCLLSANATLASEKHYYLVQFKDKSGNGYSLEKPEKYLSQRALERRKKFKIKTDYSDLPVSEKYVQQITAKGFKVMYRTKWLNGVLVISETEIKAELEKIAAVIKVTDLGSRTARDAANSERSNTPIKVTNNLTVDDSIYGAAYEQAKMIHIQELHKLGFKGQGVHIAVLDAGFRNADLLEIFGDLFQSKRFLGYTDIIENSVVFTPDNHGTQVLSCMAANKPGVMTGTAPEASYYLFRTEYASSEFPAEEAFWLIAAEKADSMGIDILNSSLGYTRFDNQDLYGHQQSDVNGLQSIATRAANFAWSKGMVLINSAGNEGDGDWYYIGCPADAIGTISVAAVNSSRTRAYFSSYGKDDMYTQKPDLAAMGANTVVCNPSGYINTANGTSFSSPVLCGAIACLLQANLNTLPSIIKHTLYAASNQADRRDNSLGYGIPNLLLAHQLCNLQNIKTEFVFNWPADSTVGKYFEILSANPECLDWDVRFYDNTDEMMLETNFRREGQLFHAVPMIPDVFYGGTYRLDILKDGEVIYSKVFMVDMGAPGDEMPVVEGDY